MDFKSTFLIAFNSIYHIVVINNYFECLAKPAKLAKVVTYGLCELRGLGENIKKI